MTLGAHNVSGLPASIATPVGFWVVSGLIILVGLFQQRWISEVFQTYAVNRSVAVFSAQLPEPTDNDRAPSVIEITLPSGKSTCTIATTQTLGEHEGKITCVTETTRRSTGTDDPRTVNIPAQLVDKLGLPSPPLPVSFVRSDEGAHAESLNFRWTISIGLGLIAASLGGLSLRRELSNASKAVQQLLPWILFALPFVLRVTLELVGITEPRYLDANWQFVFARIALAPIAEELFFRAGLLALLLTRLPPKHAIILSSLAFGFSHEFDYLTVANAVAGGLLLGWVWVKYRSVGLCILVHAGMNASVITSRLLTLLLSVG